MPASDNGDHTIGAGTRPDLRSSFLRLTCRLELASVPNSVFWARRQTVDVLTAWDIVELIEPVVAVVSELVTNAVRHPRVPAEFMAPFGSFSGAYRIAVTLVVIPGSLFVDVHDPDPTPPILPSASRRQSQETNEGRGLLAVAALCRRMNYYQPAAGGKSVWADFPISR